MRVCSGCGETQTTPSRPRPPGAPGTESGLAGGRSGVGIRDPSSLGTPGTSEQQGAEEAPGPGSRLPHLLVV